MKTLPPHQWESEGGLYDKRLGYSRPLRRAYSWHFRNITCGKELCACLRAGPFQWPGLYALYFLTDDGATLSFDAVRENLRSVIDSIRTKCSDGWRVVALASMAETDGEVTCEHTGKAIE